MVDYTPILKMHLPVFDQEPWDEDINGNFSVLDAVYGQVFGTVGVVGVWQNSHAYTSGQAVIDGTDSSIWTCLIGHTSAAVPTTFATDRTNNPSYWSQTQHGAQYYAQQAAASSSAAQVASTNASVSETNAAASATNAANSAASAANKVPLAGGTMTGLLILSGDPTVVLGAATKQYVDSRVGGTGYLPLSGGTLTGALTLSGNPTTALQAAPKQYVDLMLPKTGGALTGALSSNTTISTSSNMYASAFVIPSQGYFGGDANVTYLVMDGGSWRWQYTRSTGNIAFIRGYDGGANFTISPSGDISAPGRVTGSSIYASGSGLQLSGDANYSYIWMDPNNWRFQYQRSTGALWYVRSDGVLLFNFGPGGDLSIASNYNGGSINLSGNVYTQTLYIHYPTIGDFYIADNGAMRFINFAANWFFRWLTSGGNLQFVTPNGIVVDFDGNGITVINSLITRVQGTGQRFGFRYDGYTLIYWCDGAEHSVQPMSDERTKTDIDVPTVDCLALVNQLPINQFRWMKYDVANKTYTADPSAPLVQVGFIAQRVGAVFPDGEIGPELTNSQVEEAPVMHNVNLNSICAALVGAVQQLTTRVTALENPPAP